MQQISLINFIPGTYQRQWEEGLKKIRDILVISHHDTISDLYLIKKTVVKEYVLDTIPTTETHEKEEWIAAYQTSTKQLGELNRGRQCSFNPEKLLLFLGTVEYKRVEEK